MGNRSTSIKRKSDFEDLVFKGRKARSVSWLIIDFNISKASEPERFTIGLGLSISKKNGGAVVRNRIKRWCRDFFERKSKSPRWSGTLRVNVRLKGNENFFKTIEFNDFQKALENSWCYILGKV